MQAPEPQKQHRWLLQHFVGEWTYEGEADMGGQISRSAGTETVRPVGELWVVAEGRGTMPGGAPATSLLTLGYDPQRGQFVGTWIGSMMTELWSYDSGTLDPAEKVLTLECDGPSFDDAERAAGKTSRYRDVMELRSDRHRVLSSFVRSDDGTWMQFMTSHYRRKE